MRQDLTVRRMNRLFEDLLGNRMMPAISNVQGQFYLNTDISDKGDYFEVKAEMPGVNKDNVEIEVDNRNIKISVRSSSTSEENKDRYLLKEIVSGSASRSFSFNELLDSDNAKADFENGVLMLTVPKKHASVKKVLTFSS